jgi:hypothetical protein
MTSQITNIAQATDALKAANIAYLSVTDWGANGDREVELRCGKKFRAKTWDTVVKNAIAFAAKH